MSTEEVLRRRVANDKGAQRMNDFVDLEWHRDGFGLLPASDDPDRGLALWVPSRNGKGGEARMCSCAAAKRRMCAHQRRLVKLARRFDEELPGFATRAFEASLWSPHRRSLSLPLGAMVAARFA